MKFPHRYESTGSDHFQILLDRQMKRIGDIGNVGQLILKLEGNDIEDIIQDRLDSSLIREIVKLKYSSGSLFGKPQWESTANLNTEILNIYRKKIDYNHRPIPKMNPKNGGLIQVDLYVEATCTVMIYSWHHALSDARGAESIALYLCGIIEDITFDDLLPVIKQKPVMELLNNAKLAKDYLVKHRDWEISNLVNRKVGRQSIPRIQILNFAEEETLSIGDEAAKHVRFGKAPYFLGGVCIAFKSILSSRDIQLESLMVPVPQDQRLRGSIKPVLSNQVSYLFYRLQSNDCADIGTAAKSISGQMMTQIKERIPHHYGDMMQLFKRLPLFLYNHLSKGPTKGAFASFFFSDTGRSLSQLVEKNTTKIKVIDATHLPPVSLYPGCTVVFMEFNKKLKVIISTTQASMTEIESVSFARELKSTLLADYGSRL